jgi:hypothetical protein
VNKSSLTRARQQLGWGRDAGLIRAVTRPLGREEDLSRGLRVLALGGTLLAVPDSAANNDAFGKSGSHRSPMGYPQARVDAVAECSSHAVLDAVVGGFNESERIVSDALEAHVGSGTLLPADRRLSCLARWHRLRDQDTHLLWRIERRKGRPAFGVGGVVTQGPGHRRTLPVQAVPQERSPPSGRVGTADLREQGDA